MKYDPNIHHRHSMRLKEYDYTTVGSYFITICTLNRENLFGKIVEGSMILNEYGLVVEKTWLDLPNHNPNIKLDEFLIMPNHVHSIIEITVGAGSKPALGTNSDLNLNSIINADKQIDWAGLEPAPTKSMSLSEIVRQLKTFSAKEINKKRNTKGTSIWQRTFFEHIIQNENELYKIRKYIRDNPTNWKIDENFMEIV